MGPIDGARGGAAGGPLNADMLGAMGGHMGGHSIGGADGTVTSVCTGAVSIGAAAICCCCFGAIDDRLDGLGMSDCMNLVSAMIVLTHECLMQSLHARTAW